MNQVERIMQFSTGHWISQMLYAFVKNEMGDAFDQQPKSAQAIASTCSLQSDATYRLLRALATIGILKQQDGEPETFELTETGNLLTRSHPMSQVDKVLLEAGYEHVLLWTHLAEYLQTGEMAPAKIFGLDNYFGLFESRPGHLEVFGKAMSSYTNDEVAMIMAMETLDFSGIEKMVDVGGAFGALLLAILDKQPHMKGILFDQPAVVERVQNTEQMETMGGIFSHRYRQTVMVIF